ncbi:glycoside hydrolase family 43 protein [Sphaerobolus stellatus SS14]|uniref:Unplaced genomic scaffold SPHSTscaffold_86, whole genome shotgun sequence n=1 Tax=Sphaerobolus stellatus (strain SS14) TaxID=990650 RepID=A0A0C9VLH0_SPHS4|nr:glycoside hydrolase family 43 protein [Sphaerobolus stellatus SS14]
MFFPSFLIALVSGAAVLAASPQNSTFQNPLIPGFHPDPSCIFVPEWDDTFFCATSSFNAFPGIPVFASKDLQNMKQIGNVLNRPTQLPGLGTTNGSTSGIWAPSIRYHNGTFYLVTTMVYDNLAFDNISRWDNIIFKTTDPYADHWSDPVHFMFEGYDTSPFWDLDGKTYIVGSHEYKVFPMIQGFEIDLETGVSGPIMDLWPGTGGHAPEGPHMYYKDDYYYLMIAEGGTGVTHMETIARSRNLTGPFNSNPANPILTNANTTEYFQTVGHADIFQDSHGDWWTVALSTRSGPAHVYYPMGRETILTAAKWEEGEWPILSPVRGQETGPLPRPNKNVPGIGTWIGQPTDHLTFNPGTVLPKHFVYNRFPDTSAFTISPPGHPHNLRLIPSVLNLTTLDGLTAATPQTFVGRRQEHVEFTLNVTLDFDPKQEEEEAGITVFLSQTQHFDLGVVALSPEQAVAAGYKGDSMDNTPTLSQYVRLRTISPHSSALGSKDTQSHPGIFSIGDNDSRGIKLQIEAVNSTWYAFRYQAPSQTNWTTVGWGISSEVSGGFTGTILGMFATGNGVEGKDPAYFSDFLYAGNSSVF